ncbi:MAG: energy transducer TonB, partial [Mucilaginibacter sp.]
TISRSTTVKLFNNKAEQVFLTPASSLNPGMNENSVQIEPAKLKPISARKLSGKVINLAEDEPVFITVEKEPEFKGGISEFYRFLNQNLRYPEAMLKYNVQGKVFITLTVEKDGSLSDIKSVRDVGYGSADEAIRVLKLSPKWDPGYQNGHRVRVRYTLPITFAIVSAKSGKDTTVKTPGPETKIVRSSFNLSSSGDTSKKFNTTLIGLDTQLTPLYVLDGKEVADLNNVNPESIESIRVIKQRSEVDSYVIFYGKRALNGVVVVKTRKSKAPFPLH